MEGAQGTSSRRASRRRKKMILSEPDFGKVLMDEISGWRSLRVSSGRKETKIARLGAEEIRDGHAEHAQRKRF